jgi:hypothetical protein
MTMRSSLGAAGLLAVALALPLPAAAEKPPLTPPYLSGELAFSEVLAFDYDRDGKPDKVQFWIAVEGQPAVGKAGEPGARPESGSIRYFVYDVERSKKVKDWLMGFNMGFPVADEPHPIAKISVDGRTARFELRGATWTITDAGDSWDEDEISLKDASGVRKGRFYGGDLRVVPAESVVAAGPLAIEANAACNECHEDAAAEMAKSGGAHRELECASCHTEHPPDEEGAIPRCLSCHEAHGAEMKDASCTGCHRGHAPATLTYAATVPDAHCAACHADVPKTLEASRSRHMGIACAVCHRTEHGATQSCQFCHRATHPEHVMRKTGVCASCHKTAHDLRSGRER